MSKSKRIKNDSSVDALDDNIKDSQLSKDVKTILQTDENRGIKDNMISELCAWLLKQEGKIKELELGNNQITSKGASQLFDTLREANSSIKKISLQFTKNIDDECMKSLGVYIKSNKCIEVIDLNYCNISDKGIRILAPYLNGNISFRRLYLDANFEITEKVAPVMVKLIEASNIEEIALVGSEIEENGTLYIYLTCNAIKNGCTELQSFDRNLTDANLIKICDVMKKYGVEKLKEINLEDNQISSKGASVLFNTLKECYSVVSELNLSHNQLDDECMKELGKFLQENEHLEKLGLAENEITDKGIKILSEYLIGNTALKELDISGNSSITNESVPYIIETAKRSCVNEIEWYDTSITDKHKEKIEQATHASIEQREIPIKSNAKSAAKIHSSASEATR